jgi:reactive intermediate/imine deaminase
MKKLLLIAIASSQLLITGASYAHDSANKNVEFFNSKPSSKALPFSEAVRVDNTLYLSGQIGFNSKTRKLAEGGFKAEAEQTLTNIKESLKRQGHSMDSVVKCMVMLTDIADFKAFNEVYTSYFSPPYPARSAFAVSQLALNAKVEVECIAAVNK